MKQLDPRPHKEHGWMLEILSLVGLLSIIGLLGWLLFVGFPKPAIPPTEEPMPFEKDGIDFDKPPPPAQFAPTSE